MYKFFLNEIKDKKGITLMEILIVVLVLAVLVAVAIPVFFSTTSKTNEKICKENNEIIYNAIDSALTNELYADSGTSFFLTGGTGTYSFAFHHQENQDENISITTVTGDWDRLFNSSSPSVGTDPVKFLNDTFFGGRLPYCPSGDEKNYETDITVYFTFDEDGDPYISKISCEHYSEEYPAP